MDGKESISEIIKLEKSNRQLNLTISPNPFSDAIYIQSNVSLNTSDKLNYALTNINGQQILQGKTTLLDLEARLNSFFMKSANGVYLLKIGEEETFKLVKE